jgi:hypothetical protein
MISYNQKGYFIYHTSQGPSVALKDMLQFIRSQSKSKAPQFAHVEGKTSLIPHLSLWENLHVVTGGHSWSEIVSSIETELQPLFNLIQNPNIQSQKASAWERLTVGLIKASLMRTPNILIEICEEEHSEMNLMNFKKVLNQLAQNKVIFLATKKPDEWVNDAQYLVRRSGYEFVVENLIENKIKKSKIA